MASGSTLPTNVKDIEAESEAVTLYGIDLAKYSRSIQLAICVGGTVFFYLMYGYLQEALFKVEGFHYGWFLTFVQFVLYTLFSGSERLIKGEATSKKYVVLLSRRIDPR